jgi:hypothetical protein
MIDDDDLRAWCDAMAALLDLPIECGDRSEIINNLRIIARQMTLVDEIARYDLAEPAPVFRA